MILEILQVFFDIFTKYFYFFLFFNTKLYVNCIIIDYSLTLYLQTVRITIYYLYFRLGENYNGDSQEYN